MPPGVETWGFVENLAAFLAGDTAMTVSWPPYGRWAAGYGTDEEALSWVPKSEIAGKVGYALPPGGHPQLAAGFLALSCFGVIQEQGSCLSLHPVAELRGRRHSSAYNSPMRCAIPSGTAISQARSTNPAGQRPLNIWMRSKQGAVSGLLDLSLIQTDKYEEALRQGVSRLWAGEEPQAILDDVAAQWDTPSPRSIGVGQAKGSLCRLGL